MAALDEKEIPFRYEQAVQDLFAEPLFRLVIDFLLVLLGDVEPDAWERLRRILHQDMPDSETGATGRDWDAFMKRKKEFVRESPNVETVWLVVEQMLNKMGTELVRGLSHDYESESRRNEILENSKGHVCAVLSDTIGSVDCLKAIGCSEAVRILTIHKCKGMEFHTVIVQGVETQTFFGRKKDSECTFFVAISRAMERLVTTVAEHREKLEGANSRWEETRTPHQQFLGYIEPEIGRPSLR